MIGNIGPVQLLILLLIVVLVFGTKRLRNLGSDLGSAVRGFRKGLSEEDESEPEQLESKEPTAQTTQEKADRPEDV